eukprot:3932252-Rhodomonas_salina.2
MECTLLEEEKKWVIDVDGNVEELVKAGFLKKGALTISEEDALRFEKLSIVYAKVVLQCLLGIEFIKGRFVFFSICTRHKKIEEIGGCDREKGVCFKKLSLHITLNVSASQEKWRFAWFAVRKYIQTHLSVFSQEEQDAVKYVGCADDEHVLRNSRGQNMSTVFASKPVKNGDKAEPLFTFRWMFMFDLEGKVLHQGDESGFLKNDMVKYWVTSMVVMDPFCLKCNNGWKNIEMEENIRKRKYKEGNGESEGNKSCKVTSTWDSNQVPKFVQDLLLGGSGTFVNTTMESLARGIPKIIPTNAMDDGCLYLFHVGHPKLCILRLISLRPVIHSHEKNGCKVCVYKEKKGIGYNTRVFVWCYCTNGFKASKDVPVTDYARTKDALRLQSVYMGGWREIFESDLQRYRQLQNAGATSYKPSL